MKEKSKNPKNCSEIAKKSLVFPLFGKKSFLNRTLGLRKSFLNQTSYVLKNRLHQQSFLNRDSFLNQAFLNRECTVYNASMKHDFYVIDRKVRRGRKLKTIMLKVVLFYVCEQN